MTRIFFACLVLLLFSCTNKKVDLIIHNAIIYTVDSTNTMAEAVAVHEGKIVAVGKNNEIMDQYSSDQLIDAQGKPVYPGFIDAHAHFVGYGKALFTVDLFGCKDWNEAVQRVQAFAKEHPEEQWILGRGWNQNDWPGKSFPTNEQLNTLFPDRPVMLTRVDGHAAVVNAKAIEIASIQPDQKLVGGEVETRNGTLTGILVDNAVDLVSAKLPAASKADHEKWLMTAQKNCFAQGLTTIADCGLMYSDVEMIDALHKEDKLKMRLYVMLSDEKANYDRFLSKGPYRTDRMYVKGIKVYADGALGSRGACLLKHYSDRKDWFGFLLKDRTYFDSLATALAATDFQMCTHAIGDSANREMLNIYNRVLKGKNDKRWRIEHAQVINENDFDLFGSASIIPSVQPTHATSDMYWAGERLGNERVKGAYAFKRLLDQNGWIPLGTDFPVEDISPFKTFFAAVVRQDAKGFPANGFQKENALSREETLKGMTIWAAKACFMENEVGSIEKGKKADLIILDRDIMKVAENQLLGTKVLNTFVNGQKVH